MTCEILQRFYCSIKCPFFDFGIIFCLSITKKGKQLMDKEPYFRRILLKLSGEALQGAGGSIDPDAVLATAELIREATLSGSEVAVILGAGNLFRGLTGCRKGMDRNCADYMGMLATCMNALAVRDALESLDISAEIQSALPIDGVLEPFDYRKADRLLNIGTVLLFAAGTGHPFFTTDTTAALRACEIKADAVFKATKVNGVYSEDPMKNPAAVRYGPSRWLYFRRR